MFNEKNLVEFDRVMVFTVLFYHGLLGIDIFSSFHTLVMLGGSYTMGALWAPILILAISAACAAYLCWRVITLTEKKA